MRASGDQPDPELSWARHGHRVHGWDLFRITLEHGHSPCFSVVELCCWPFPCCSRQSWGDRPSGHPPVRTSTQLSRQTGCTVQNLCGLQSSPGPVPCGYRNSQKIQGQHNAHALVPHRGTWWHLGVKYISPPSVSPPQCSTLTSSVPSAPTVPSVTELEQQPTWHQTAPTLTAGPHRCPPSFSPHHRFLLLL